MMKCRTCQLEKEETDFYKQSNSSFFLDCKECVKARVRKHRLENIEYVQEYDRMRGSLPHRKEAVKARTWKYKPKSSIWRNKNKEKYAAHLIVNNSIRAGKFTTGTVCEQCGSIKQLEAHHDDYSKPLEIRWLCRICHAAHHKRLNEEKRKRK